MPIDLSIQRMSGYDYEHRNRDDDFEPLMRRILAWYATSPAMKIFIDRISDLLEIPELLSEGRRLRGKSAYVACTSISMEPAAAFVGAFRDTFAYLGMHFGGIAHVNCCDGYLPPMHEAETSRFASLVREASIGSPSAGRAPPVGQTTP